MKGDTMKYDFVKVDDDTTILKYKDKEFEMKKTVGLLQKLQSINNKAKIQMMKELKEQGMTANDLVVVRKEGNKTIEDKSNLIELEQYYVGVASESLYEELCKDYCGMGFAELLVDIGIDVENKDELKKFMTEFTYSITPTTKTPREEK